MRKPLLAKVTLKPSLAPFKWKFNPYITFAKLQIMEGGYSGQYTDHPADFGGPTKFGVILSTYNNAIDKGWIKGDKGPAGLKTLTWEEAYTIFNKGFASFVPRTVPHPIAESAIYAVWGSGFGGLKWIEKYGGKLSNLMDLKVTSPKVNQWYDAMFLGHFHRIKYAASLVREKDGKSYPQSVFQDGWMNGISSIYYSNYSNGFQFWGLGFKYQDLLKT